MNALTFSLTGMTLLIVSLSRYCSAEEPSMFLCLDSMMHLKSATGSDPQKLVYGYIEGKKTPCMTEYEFRMKYSQDTFNRTRKKDKKSSPEMIKRETIYKGDKKLANADLRGLDLQGVDLSGADLHNAQLVSADLRGANLKKADLSGANLENAYCKNADLQGADLTNAQVKGVYFHNTDLRNTEGLTVEQLESVSTLYKAQIEATILEIIEKRYPSKLRDPKNSWTQQFFSSDEGTLQTELADPESFH